MKKKRPVDIECTKCHTITDEQEYMLHGRCPHCGSEKADWEYRFPPYRDRYPIFIPTPP